MTPTNVYQIGDPYQDTDTMWNPEGNTCYLLRAEEPANPQYVVCKHTPTFYSLYTADYTGEPMERIGQAKSIRLLMEYNDLKLIQTPNATPGQDTTK